MKIREAAMILLMILIAGVIMLYPQKHPFSIVIGLHEYTFEHSYRDIERVPVHADRPIASFFNNNTNFTVTFDPSNPRDNAYFSKVGFNLVSKLRYFFVDRGVSKNFVAKYYNDLNDSDRNLIILRGPHSGAIQTGVSLSGNTLIIEGLTYDGLERASERAVLEAFGLNITNGPSPAR